MQINELFEAHLIGPMDPIDDKEEFFKIIDQVKQSDVYKRLMNIMNDVSGKVASRNGTIMLEPKNGPKMSQNIYKVQRNGQIRIAMASSTNSSLTTQVRVKSPEPVADLYQRYINALEEVERKFAKRVKTASTERTLKGADIENLADINLDGIIYLTIERATIKNLIGCPITVKRLVLSDCKYLESFEGCPEKLDKLSIIGIMDIFSFEHFPKKITESLYFGSSVYIKSFSGINKFVKDLTGRITIPESFKGPILSLLKVKGIKDFDTHGWERNDTRPIRKVLNILTKNYQTDGSSNLIASQEELFKNGFDEYAKL